MSANGRPTGYLQLEAYDIDQARQALRKATQVILDLESDYALRVSEAADAESLYRRELGEAVRRYRKDGMGVEESTIAARAEVAMHTHARDTAAGNLKLAAEKLEDARDTRRSLWRVIEWSARATTGAPVSRIGDTPATDERLPGSDWPGRR